MTFAEEEIVALRRTLHAQPEIGLDLPQTQRTLIDALSELKLETTLGTRLSSITGVLRGGKPGPTVLLRSDMDALPIAEATGLPFASANGAMHACGHDMHMAGLVGAARILAERRAELPGNVVFMFQPGEEGFAGGRIMIEEGVLDAAGERPVAAYAMHVDCGTESGLFLTRPGPIMSSASGLELLVNGKGGHAALPHLLIDPVPVAAEIVLAFQSFVARRVPVGDPAVVSVTRLHTNSGAGNVVPSTVAIEANIRTLSRETLKLVREELPRLARALGEAHGCTVDAEFIDSYPVTHNDPAETAAVLDQLGDRAQLLPHPGMASEDFAYVLEEVPGTLVFVGARPAGVDPHDQPAMHSALATFDDGVLGVQAATLAELAWRRLHQAG